VQEEIEKVKRRREQREAERAAMAEELEMIQRERAIAEAADLEKKEEEVGGSVCNSGSAWVRVWVQGRRHMGGGRAGAQPGVWC